MIKETLYNETVHELKVSIIRVLELELPYEKTDDCRLERGKGNTCYFSPLIKRRKIPYLYLIGKEGQDV